MTANWLLHWMIDRDLLDDCHRVPALEPKWLWAMAVFYGRLWFKGLITVFRSNSSPQDGPKSGSSLGSLTIQQATFKPTFKLSNKRSNLQTNFQTNLQTFKQTFKLSNQLSNQPSNFQTNFQTFKPTFKARDCVTRVVQRSCQAREHKKYMFCPQDYVLL
jgi:hypothetical protein